MIPDDPATTCTGLGETRAFEPGHLPGPEFRCWFVDRPAYRWTAGLRAVRGCRPQVGSRRPVDVDDVASDPHHLAVPDTP